MKPLLWWVDKTSKPNVYFLKEGTTFVGRLKEEDIEKYHINSPFGLVGVYILGLDECIYTSIDDVTVSRRHAKVIVKEGKVTISDYGPVGKGSLNGTFVNGIKISAQPYGLTKGDVIRIGAKDNPTEFIVGEADSKTGRPIIQLPTMKPIFPFSNALEKATEKLPNTDKVVLRPEARISFVDEYGIRYEASQRPLYGMLITLQEAANIISNALNNRERLSSIENAFRQIYAYFESESYRSLLREPALLRLGNNCRELAREILDGYGSTEKAEALCHDLRDFITMLRTILMV